MVSCSLLQSIGGFRIEDFKSKELRTCCSTLRIKGVKNAQKYTMVERITEQKHQTMGIVADVKPPRSIAVEAQARKRARLEKISEIAEAVGLGLGQQHPQRGVGNESGTSTHMHVLLRWNVNVYMCGSANGAVFKEKGCKRTCDASIGSGKDEN